MIYRQDVPARPRWLSYLVLFMMATISLPLMLGHAQESASTEPPTTEEPSPLSPDAASAQAAEQQESQPPGENSAKPDNQSLLQRMLATAFRSDQPPDNLYDVPDGDVAELVTFIGRLRRYHPRTVEQDVEYRRRANPAMLQAAERVLTLVNDPDSRIRLSAEVIVLQNRIRRLPGAVPAEQSVILETVKDFVTKRLQNGETRISLELAELTCNTLQQAGQYRRASEASRTLGKLFLEHDGDGGGMRAHFLRTNADWLQAKAAEFRPDEVELMLPRRDRLVSLDIQGVANWSLDDLSGPGVFEGNSLAELPLGNQTLGGVPFTVGKRLMLLGGKKTPFLPKKVEDVRVGTKFQRLFALHSTQFGMPPHLLNDGDVIGEYTINYEDGPSVSLPIVFGHHVRDWWSDDKGRPVKEGIVVWTGTNRAAQWNNVSLRIYLGVWENPHPEKTVTTLDFLSTDTDAGPFCVALSVEKTAASDSGQ